MTTISRNLIVLIGLAGSFATQFTFLINWMKWVVHPVSGGVAFTFVESSSLIIYTETVLLLFTSWFALIGFWLTLQAWSQEWKGRKTSG